MSILFPSKNPGMEYKQPIEPSNPAEGMTWLDTSETDSISGAVPKKYFSGEWVTMDQYISYGYTFGGYTSDKLSTIDRIEFPFDSGVASHVGNLSDSKYRCFANNSSQFGYICGGTIVFNTTAIEKIQFPFSSGTSSAAGTVSREVARGGACNSSLHGYICGGDDGDNNYSTIDRFSFSTGTISTNVVGNLTDSRNYMKAANSSNYGYTCGGSGWTSKVDRITFPFESGTASNVGSLSGTRGSLSSNNSSVSCYSYGGQTGYSVTVFSIIDRFIFPFDSGSATQVGSLSTDIVNVMANNSSLHGYICGGDDGDRTSKIDRITFSFDSGTAGNVGNLSGSRYNSQATDNVDFVGQLLYKY